MINIYVQRTLAKACSDAPITSGSVGLTAQFLFSEEWNELTKKAIFETDNYKEPVDVPASGEVIVPESVLVYPWTQLRVGVRGESEDGYVVIPTVYADCGTIRLGANTTPVGTPPTPSQAEYLQAQIDELRESGVGGKAYVQDTEPAQMEVGEFWYNPDEETEGIPTTLPNPHKLTFSGAVNAEYDGSESVEVVIPQGGGGSSGGEEWELINSVVTTEEVKSMIFDADSNGNPFSLKKALFVEYLAPYTGTETLGAYMHSKRNDSMYTCLYTGAPCADKTKWVSLEWFVEATDDFVREQWGFGSRVSADIAASSTMNRAMATNNGVGYTKVLGYTHSIGVYNQIIPIGSIFQLYGVRA